MNPWFSVWTKPRQTIRQIVETNPRQSVLLLAVTTGSLELLFQVLLRYDRQVPILFAVLTALVVGALIGFGNLYLTGWLYGRIGVSFHGQGSGLQLRAAIAWAELPKLTLFVLWMIFLVVTKGELLNTWREGVELSTLGVIAYALHFTSLCIMVSEVHRLNLFKGVWIVIIPNACLFAFFYLLMVFYKFMW